MKTTGKILIGVGIISLLGLGFNQYTCSTFKSDIQEKEKINKETAKEYCKWRLNYNYNKFNGFLNILDGSDNAAREYLELQKIIDSEK